MKKIELLMQHLDHFCNISSHKYLHDILQAIALPAVSFVIYNGRILRHRAPAKCSKLDRFLHDSELKYVFIVRNGTISKILYSAPRNGYYTLNNCKRNL